MRSRWWRRSLRLTIRNERFCTTAIEVVQPKLCLVWLGLQFYSHITRAVEKIVVVSRLPLLHREYGPARQAKLRCRSNGEYCPHNELARRPEHSQSA